VRNEEDIFSDEKVRITDRFMRRGRHGVKLSFVVRVENVSADNVAMVSADEQPTLDVEQGVHHVLGAFVLSKNHQLNLTSQITWN
jgi:hypothetical protein